MLLFQLLSQSLQTVSREVKWFLKSTLHITNILTFFPKCFNPQLSHNNLVVLNGNGKPVAGPVVFLEGHTKELRSRAGYSTR